MSKFDFETIVEYLNDRYTTADLVDELDIPMNVLVDALYDWIVENRSTELSDIVDTGEEQLSFEF